jgi:hypothetical protein
MEGSTIRVGCREAVCGRNWGFVDVCREEQHSGKLESISPMWSVTSYPAWDAGATSTLIKCYLSDIKHNQATHCPALQFNPGDVVGSPNTHLDRKRRCDRTDMLR